MPKSRTGQFIRGGQTTQHWFRMAVQVLKYAIIAGAFGALISYSFLVWRNYELSKVQTSYYWLIARFAVENRDDPERPIHLLTLEGQRETWPAEQVYRDRAMATIYARYEANAVRFLYLSIPWGVLAAVLTVVIFWFSGRNLGDDEFVRGSRLVTKKELIAWSRAKWRDYNKANGKPRKTVSPFNISGVPFPPRTVEAQTGIFGTVGVGKTTTFKDLLTSVREEGARAILYDNTGSFVKDYYDPTRDIIVNPFDARSHVWSPFGEAATPEAFAQIAEVMVPIRPGERDPFWTNTARLVFEYVARKLVAEGRPTNEALRNAIMELPADKLQELLAATPGAHFVNPKMDKTAANIRANMIAELRFLEFLRDDGAPFSIRDWVKNDDGRGGFVFLTGDAEHAAATRNIISTCMEVASNALMTETECFEPRLWLFIDELPSLNRLPFIVNHLAQVRKYGGAFVLGWQVYSQIEDVYGDKGAQSILGNLNNRVIFNTPDARTAQIFSENLGKTDLLETRENLTLGAHSARDGVGMLSGRTERALASPSELQALPQFQCFVRFAYDAPAAKIELDPVKDPENPQPMLIKYSGDGFAHGAMDPSKEPADPSIPPEEVKTNVSAGDLQVFEEWFRNLSRNIDQDDRELRKLPDTLDERRSLWRHYTIERQKGIPIDQISRPQFDGRGLASNRPGAYRAPIRQDVPPYPTRLAVDLGLIPGLTRQPSEPDSKPASDTKPARHGPQRPAPQSREHRQTEMLLTGAAVAARKTGQTTAPDWDIARLDPNAPLTHLPLSAPEIVILTDAGCRTVGEFGTLKTDDILSLEGLSPGRKSVILAALSGATVRPSARPPTLSVSEPDQVKRSDPSNGGDRASPLIYLRSLK